MITFAVPFISGGREQIRDIEGKDKTKFPNLFAIVREFLFLLVERTTHIRKHFRTKQPVPLSLIAKANEATQFNTLTVWITLKQLYKRRTVLYHLNYSTLSNATGLSHTHLRKHIRIMVENKWAKHTKNGHLILTAINKLKKHKYETCILVPVCKKKADQILQLRKVLLHRNIENQKKQIFDKREIVNNCGRANGKLSPKQIKQVRQAGGIENFEKQINSVTTLSNKSIGKLFRRTPLNGKTNLSPVTGQRIQRNLRAAGLIKTKARFKLFCKMDEYQYIYERRNYLLPKQIYNPVTGEVLTRLSNEITMPKQ